ncbi:hypothetical protein [Helicobacter sp. T3_23-1056]
MDGIKITLSQKQMKELDKMFSGFNVNSWFNSSRQNPQDTSSQENTTSQEQSTKKPTQNKKSISKEQQESYMQDCASLLEGLQKRQEQCRAEIEKLKDNNAFAQDDDVVMQSLQEKYENLKQMILDAQKLQHELQNANIKS